jgi:hypothetical protein
MAFTIGDYYVGHFDSIVNNIMELYFYYSMFLNSEC